MFCEEVHLYGSNLQQKMAAHICLNTQVMMSDTQPKASNEGLTKVREDFTITEKAPTSAFTIKTLVRHYVKQTLTQGM